MVELFYRHAESFHKKGEMTHHRLPLIQSKLLIFNRSNLRWKRLLTQSLRYNNNLGLHLKLIFSISRILLHIRTECKLVCRDW